MSALLPDSAGGLEPRESVLFVEPNERLLDLLCQYIGEADARRILGEGVPVPLSEVFVEGDEEIAASRQVLKELFNSPEPVVEYGEQAPVYGSVLMQDGLLSAQACMKPSEAWVHEYLHGPDMTYALISFAAELLLPGEQFEELCSVQYRRLATHQLEFLASEEQQKLVPCNGIEPTVKGSLRTNQGREIFFGGYATDQALPSGAYRFSRLPTDILGYAPGQRAQWCKRLEGNRFFFPYMGFDSGEAPSFQKRVYTAQELVMHMVTVNVAEGFFGSEFTFAGGFSQFRPPDWSFFANEGWVGLQWMPEQKRSTERGFELIPCQVEFVNDSFESSGGGTYTHIVPSSAEVFDDLLLRHFPELEQESS